MEGVDGAQVLGATNARVEELIGTIIFRIFFASAMLLLEGT